MKLFENILTRTLWLLLFAFSWKKKIFLANRRHLHFSSEVNYSKTLLSMCREITVFLFGKTDSDIVMDKKSATHLRDMKKGPCLFLTYHYGNFELLGFYLRDSGLDVCAAYLPPHSRIFHRLLQALRDRGGKFTLPAENNIRNIFRHVSNGGCFAFLTDQDPGISKHPTTLLGKACYFPTLPYSILKYCQPDIYFGVLCRRESDYLLTIRKHEHGELSENIQHFLEKNLHEAPKHWYGWFHRRFKSIDEKIYQ